jgi:hypothetical protein
MPKRKCQFNEELQTNVTNVPQLTATEFKHVQNQPIYCRNNVILNVDESLNK